MAVSIGITGHRQLSPQQLHLLEPVIRKAINTIIDHHKSIDGTPDNSLVFSSALAEGADTLFAQIVVRHYEAPLIAYIPFEEEEYRKDFTTTESKTAFEQLLHHNRVAKVKQTGSLLHTNDREALYWQVGVELVNNNTYILAVWDGQPARGKGGTAEVVAYAIQQHKRVVIINPGYLTFH